jgi:hypothetical protein
MGRQEMVWAHGGHGEVTQHHDVTGAAGALHVERALGQDRDPVAPLAVEQLLAPRLAGKLGGARELSSALVAEGGEQLFDGACGAVSIHGAMIASRRAPGYPLSTRAAVVALTAR